MDGDDRVEVWGSLTKIFHWLLVAAVAIVCLAVDEELPLPHIWAGYIIMGLLLLRLLWASLSVVHARVSHFVYPPSAGLAFVRDAFGGKIKRYSRPTPAGAWMPWTLPAVIALTGITGLLLYGASEHLGAAAGFMVGAGKELTQTLGGLHEFFAGFTVFLIMVHAAAMAAEKILNKANLARAKVPGINVEGKRRTAGKAGVKRMAILGLCAAMGMMSFSGQVKAAPGGATSLPPPDGLLPLETVIDKAKKLHEGEVIEAEFISIKGQDLYEVEILDEGGKVWEMFFDAKTGEPVDHVEEKDSAGSSH
jgi:cytochrome b